MNEQNICVDDVTSNSNTSTSASNSSTRFMQSLSLLDRLRLISHLQSQRAAPPVPPSNNPRSSIVPQNSSSSRTDNNFLFDDEEEELELDDLSHMNLILTRSPTILSSTEVPQIEARVFTFAKSILQLANRRRAQNRSLEMEHLFYIHVLQEIAKDYKLDVLSELVEQLQVFVVDEEQTPSQALDSLRTSVQQDTSIASLDKKYLMQAFAFVCQTALRCILLSTDRNKMEREVMTLLASVGQAISSKQFSSPYWNVLQYFHSRIYQLAIDYSISCSCTQ